MHNWKKQQILDTCSRNRVDNVIDCLVSRDAFIWCNLKSNRLERAGESQHPNLSQVRHNLQSCFHSWAAYCWGGFHCRPTAKKSLVWIPAGTFYCVELASSPCTSMGSLGVLQLPPTLQNMHVRWFLIGPWNECVCVHCCLSLCTPPLAQWQLGLTPVSPRLSRNRMDGCFHSPYCTSHFPQNSQKTILSRYMNIFYLFSWCFLGFTISLNLFSSPSSTCKSKTALKCATSLMSNRCLLLCFSKRGMLMTSYSLADTIRPIGLTWFWQPKMTYSHIPRIKVNSVI